MLSPGRNTTVYFALHFFELSFSIDAKGGLRVAFDCEIGAIERQSLMNGDIACFGLPMQVEVQMMNDTDATNMP